MLDECLLTKGRLGVAGWIGADRVVDVRAIGTSLLLKHADLVDCFLFPAPIVAVVVVNGLQTAWYTQIMLPPTPTIITTLGVETRFLSERGVNCTPVGEREDFQTVHARHITHFHMPRMLPPDGPAYPYTYRHLRLILIYYTLFLISYKPRQSHPQRYTHSSSYCPPPATPWHQSELESQTVHLRLSAAPRYADTCLHIASEQT
jgi:hypothetical protein